MPIRRLRLLLAALVLLPVSVMAQTAEQTGAQTGAQTGPQTDAPGRERPSLVAADLPRPPARDGAVPATRWRHQPGHMLWNRVALSALKGHGQPLTDLVPADIGDWCPRYEAADASGRRAFWLGFLSALAKHESTYREAAVGGGGRWHGLLQILPATARGYGCAARTGADLRKGGANLSCAIRIMAVTVPRDGVIYGRGGRGVAADWGPMRSAAKRADMQRWLRAQPYCKPLRDTRPRARPRPRTVRQSGPAPAN